MTNSSRHPDFARVGFRILDRDFVWDPVADTLADEGGRTDDLTEALHRAIRGAHLTHLPSREVVAAALATMGLEFHDLETDAGPGGPESEDLPPGAIS